ncbi:MAG: butyrate kinase, partial [Mogibacterium sp.]|nr:butyrate kinase [Mogibacterium sp.]
AGDKQAELVWEALCYNIVKYIGSMATVLKGKVDGILITGRYTRFPNLIKYIKDYTEWIAPVYVYENEVEQEAMCAGALRVLKGKEEAKVYTGKGMVHKNELFMD